MIQIFKKYCHLLKNMIRIFHYVEWISLLKIYDYTFHHIKREKKLLKIL